MCYKKAVYRIVLVLMAFLPTILFGISKIWIDIDRPILVYEYYLVILFTALNFRPIIVWLVFVAIFLLDITSVFSRIYLFELFDFINTFKYFINYSINLLQMIMIVLLIISLIGLYQLIKMIKSKLEKDRVCVYFFFVISFTTFLFDNINGSSLIIPYNSTLNFYKSNFAGSPVMMLCKNLFNQNAVTDKPILNSLNNKSVTFKQFVTDSKSNQMLIIVESFGMIDDSIKRIKFQKSISTVFRSENWNTFWGKTEFTGSTTRGELRELLNCMGDYRYFIDRKHSNKVKSIFNIKKRQGYTINAIHSYKANMFERSIWWKNIGADATYFLEDVQLAFNYKNKLNYDSPFVSLNDEEALDFILNKTKNTGKHFNYLLTENSHLPFKGNLKKPFISNIFDIDDEINLSDQAKNQSKRISSFLEYVASHLERSGLQKIIIVGDHMPPFAGKKDRLFYSNKFVPYCLVTK